MSVRNVFEGADFEEENEHGKDVVVAPVFIPMEIEGAGFSVASPTLFPKHPVIHRWHPFQLF